MKISSGTQGYSVCFSLIQVCVNMFPRFGSPLVQDRDQVTCRGFLPTEIIQSTGAHDFTNAIAGTIGLLQTR